MTPEKGDKNIRVTAADVADGFRGVGATEGRIVFFHSSLSSMGTVTGGAAAVIAGARAAVGPSGTVGVPTLWYHNADPPLRAEDWDIARSPSYVGAVSEAFRQAPESLRSDHFSHAVSAIGRRAADLTRDHGSRGRRLSPWGDRAFAVASPWQRLYDWNATYCFIGVTFRVNTMRHFMEVLLVDEILNRVPDRIRRDRLAGRITDYGTPGIWPHHDSQNMGFRFEEIGLVRIGRIGSATLRAIAVRDMIDAAMPMLRDERTDWFGEEFLDWWKEAEAET